jgi:hypothetical protein
MHRSLIQRPPDEEIRLTGRSTVQRADGRQLAHSAGADIGWHRPRSLAELDERD